MSRCAPQPSRSKSSQLKSPSTLPLSEVPSLPCLDTFLQEQATCKSVKHTGGEAEEQAGDEAGGRFADKAGKQATSEARACLDCLEGQHSPVCQTESSSAMKIYI